MKIEKKIKMTKKMFIEKEYYNLLIKEDKTVVNILKQVSWRNKYDWKFILYILPNFYEERYEYSDMWDVSDRFCSQICERFFPWEKENNKRLMRIAPFNEFDKFTIAMKLILKEFDNILEVLNNYFPKHIVDYCIEEYLYPDVRLDYIFWDRDICNELMVGKYYENEYAEEIIMEAAGNEMAEHDKQMQKEENEDNEDNEVDYSSDSESSD